VTTKKTKKALDHAYIRAFSNVAENISKEVAEGITIFKASEEVMLFSIALMEHSSPSIVDQFLSMSKPEPLVLFLVDAMYSTQRGLFHEIPRIIKSLESSTDSLALAQQFDSHILQAHIPRLSNIISRAFSAVKDPRYLYLALDK